MMSMSISYEETGRTRQKIRTRSAIIAAARGLIAGGETPTVEQAADAAGVSRATAYRYFPNQRSMLVSVYPEIEARSLLGAAPPHEIGARVDLVVREVTRMVVENEPELRTQLRLSLESSATERQRLVLRQGRVIGWLEEALEPARGKIPKGELRRLVYAIRCAIGIEALVWLCDVGGLSRKEAVEHMRWSARALLRAELVGGRATRPKARSDPR
jgi:AcrR family transcriptional regulator